MKELASFFSAGTGALGARVEGLVRRHADLWLAAPPDPGRPHKRYGRAEKRAVEREISALVGGLSAEPVRTAFLDGSIDAARLEEMAAGLRPAFRRLLRIVDLPLEEVYDGRFVEATRLFLRAARDFDPDLGLASAYQALRNVWIMNSLQFDLGLQVEHTDAIFAYSMIYPYLDNLLDDVHAAETGKLAFVRRLRGWLEGAAPAPASPAEEKLVALVRLIERQYPRSAFPGVYQSLLTIYNAQVKSLLQQRTQAAPATEDVLAISLEKGGTSVLADAYLVAGVLAPADEEFSFGFGTFLQLADDLQDVGEDSLRGHHTLFSMGGPGQPLDPTALRLESYLAAVLARAKQAGGPGRTALCEAIGSGLTLMFRESVGKQPKYFRRAFVRRAKKGFPARFSYLGRLRRRLQEDLPAGRDRLADLDPGLVALMALSSRVFSLD